MLLIGQLTPEHASEKPSRRIKAAIRDGIDILAFDIYITKDNIAIAMDDTLHKQLQRMQASAHSYTLAQLRKLDLASPPVPLDTVLDAYFGKILITLELKARASGKIVTDLLAKRTGVNQASWDSVLVSSHKPTELIAARRASSQVNLALLHELNSFAFITYQPFLDLTAVGFHRLHINSLALQIAKKAGLFTYAYTVNRPDAARHLSEIGIDGVLSNRPERISQELKRG